MRTRRSAVVEAARVAVPSPRHAVAAAAAVSDDDEAVAVARGLSQAAVCAVAASAATSAAFAVRKLTKSLYRWETSVQHKCILSLREDG